MRNKSPTNVLRRSTFSVPPFLPYAGEYTQTRLASTVDEFQKVSESELKRFKRLYNSNLALVFHCNSKSTLSACIDVWMVIDMRH